MAFLRLDDLEGALALERPQGMRHADVREDRVVPAGDRLRIAVKGAQVRVKPVGAARARHHGEIRRRDPEPTLRLLRVEGNLDRLADLLGGEHQVVLDLRFAQADLLQAVVAHELQAVAAEAVVHVRARARLQAHEVARVMRRAVEPVAFGGQHGERCGEQRGEDYLHQCHTTRSGSGLTLSRTVYQGMRKKNRK